MAHFHTHPDSEFKNLTRSTIPLLAYWRDQVKVLATIGSALGIDDLINAQVSFEWPTPSASLHDKASYTDVMVESSSTAIAIEGKWTEPRYDSVADWQHKGNEPNRKKVLSHWFDLIKQKAPTLSENRFAHIPYQMLHRTASACAMPQKHSVVMYQIFRNGHHEVDYASDLKTLANALGTTEVQVWLQEIPLEMTDDYFQLKVQLEQAQKEDIPALVRQALCERQLFRFESSRFSFMPHT